MKLDKHSVSTITLDGKSEKIEFDDELKGFGLRLRDGGRVTWICQFRAGPRQRRITIGDARKVDADKARKVAKQHLAQATLGHDPAADGAEERRKTKVTLGAVAESYLSFKADKLKPKSLHDVQQYLRVKWKPLQHVPVHKVERRDVAARLKEINAESGGYAADQAKAALSAMFGWAMRLKRFMCRLQPIISPKLRLGLQSRGCLPWRGVMRVRFPR